MERSSAWLVIATVSAVALTGVSGVASGGDQGAPAASPKAGAAQATRVPCNDLLPPIRIVKRTNGKGEFKVGPTSCSMVESQVTVDGRSFKRFDVGLDGTVDGYVSTSPTGDYRGYMTNAPMLVFPQTADAGPVVLAILNYRKEDGAAMSVVYPADPGAWNGKLWVTAHGATTRGVPLTATAFDRLDQALNSYDRQMLARGYAVAKTRRTANADGLNRTPNPPPTGLKGILETDRSITYAAFNDTHHYIKDFTLVAERLVEKRLGRSPARTYFYGHSAGARIGRGFNYVPGLNTGPDGKPLFDGFFVDDSGAGTWLPVVMKDGQDVLFKTEADKAAMVPQLEVVHQMYNNVWTPKVALGVTNSFLQNKRTNATILRDKGLTPKFRAYEVRSISHAGSGPGLDVAPLWGQMFDMLDAWVDKGVAPPPTRSDWKELGDADRDGVIENPGLGLPESACPLGVYYPTTTTSGSILFAPFTGEGLEPLDRNKIFVDMNRNGVWDYRETPTEAWRRLGLLKPNEELTREVYTSCVQAAAETLAKDGFLSAATVADYIARAKTADLKPRETTESAAAGREGGR
jgi:hypothetical protein